MRPAALSDRWVAFQVWWESGWPLRAIAALFNPHWYIDVEAAKLRRFRDLPSR